MIEVAVAGLALGTTLALGFLGLLGLERNSVLRYLQAAIGAAILWTSGSLVMAATNGPTWEALGTAIGYSGGIFLPSLWWAVTLRWAEDRELVDRPPTALVHGPLLWAGAVWVVMLLNPIHGQFITPVDGSRSLYGPLWWAMAVPNHALGLGCFVFAIRLSMRAHSKANRTEGLLFASAAGLLGLAHAAHTLWPTPLPFDAPALAIAVSSTLIVMATRADAARLAHAHQLQTQVAARTADLERANERLRALQEQMLQAERLQTEEELVGSVAHAIYNPLAALIGHAELASTDRPLDAQAATVLRLARRVEDVVDRTLQLYRKGSLELRELDPLSLLADAAGMMKISAAEVQVRVIVQHAEPAPRIRGDRALLVEALASLARNSLEAMPSGGELHFSVHSEVRPERTGARGAVVFEVTDTGSGIPAELAQQIYEPFFTTKPAGTGLGLSIVRGIVKGHRGTLDVRSRTPRGTRARITIPTEP